MHQQTCMRECVRDSSHESESQTNRPGEHCDLLGEAVFGYNFESNTVIMRVWKSEGRFLKFTSIHH